MKKNLMCGLLLGMAVLLSSCAIFGENKPEFSYPDGNKAFWDASRKSAVHAIATVDGKEPKLKRDQKYQLHLGQRKYSGMWCWYSVEWNFWVAGLCYLDGTIKPTIGCHPQTKGELHPGVAQHECGHAVLWDAKRDATHNPKYKNVLWSWYGPDPKATLQSRVFIRGFDVYSADGTPAEVEIFLVEGFPVDAEHPAP